MFLSPSAFQLRSKIDKKASQTDQKSSKKLINILMQSLTDFWFNLGRFWKDVGSKLEPSCDQMPRKPDPKTNQKNYCFSEGLQIDFG